jgi:hypothetical protein
MNRPSVIDRATWLRLAERLAEIRAARAALTAEEEQESELVFDEHDQATLRPPLPTGRTPE